MIANNENRTMIYCALTIDQTVCKENETNRFTMTSLENAPVSILSNDSEIASKNFASASLLN